MFYRLVRNIVGFALRLFYRVKVSRTLPPLTGPVMFVGNHPNALVDPALIFVITPRPVTFLAKAPLFKMPILGWLLKGLGVLPVFRKQDNPALMTQNEGTFEAATSALTAGGAITLFPEGKSHSEPMLAELKTGAARIAFRAVRKGAPVTVVPVGLTYAEKNRFRSQVLIDVGEPIDARAFLSADESGEVDAVHQLTDRIALGLQQVTLNLEKWADLALINMAEQLYAFRIGERALDPERLRRFAKGVQIFRAEQPQRFEEIRAQLMSFHHRLGLVRADPTDLTLLYRRGQVVSFVVRNLAVLLLGAPAFLAGFVLFALPFYIPRWIIRAVKVELDQQATVKFLAALVISPLWMAGLSAIAWWRLSWPWGLAVLVASLPLAVFTRYVLERLSSVRHDVRVFFALGNRARLKARLLAEGESLAAEVERVAAEFRPRVMDVPAPESRLA